MTKYHDEMKVLCQGTSFDFYDIEYAVHKVPQMPSGALLGI
jgi:hypothetical protein